MPKLEKFANPWAQDGGTVEPTLTTAKRDVGFVGGDIPPVERFNQLIGENQVAINTIIEEGPGSWYPRAADIGAMITTGLWDESWASPFDTANKINSPVNGGFRSPCVFFNTDGDPRLIIGTVATATTIFEVWDPRTLSSVDTSDDLLDDLPFATGITNNAILSVCTDGTSVYAVIANLSATPDTYYVQAWDIATWDVKAGWPANGTLLTPTGNLMRFTVIVASSTRLAVINNATTVTAAGDPVIEIINISTGAIVADGAGDAPTGVSAIADPRIVSDGTNVYFGANGTSKLYMCSAVIDAPATGCGGTDWGAYSTYDAQVGAMAMCGDYVITFLNYASPVWNNIVILTSSAADAYLGQVLRGQDSNNTPLSGESYIYENAWAAVFDGINVWAYVEIDNKSAFDSPGLLKIDLAKFRFESTINKIVMLGDMYSALFNLCEQTAYADYLNKIAFDGRDIWFSTSQTNDTLYRLPMALIRS